MVLSMYHRIQNIQAGKGKLDFNKKQYQNHTSTINIL